MGLRTRWLLVTVLVIVAVYVSLLAYTHIGRTVFKYVGAGYTVTYVRYPGLPWPLLDVRAPDPSVVFPMVTIKVGNLPSNSWYCQCLPECANN
ncbi:hypothetical protein [Vulcanisaeta sp. JCM 16159]|uniref:hypothetical protein n=1 Tax=Vulcanisaeta sp. JCM 16159 TaxID=1295371 RepID=UPI001FB5547B|nr:hypothetical protein [Vulcanisaeta sp. JCM 16159]